MSPQTYEAIVGDQDAGFYRLSEEDIRRFFYFMPVGSSVTNIKELRQQQIMTAIQMLQAIPPQIMQMNIKPFTVDWYEALSTAMDAVDIKNKDRILVALQPQQTQGLLGGLIPGGGTNPNEAQALANVMYGEGGGIQDILSQVTKAITTPPKPPPAKGASK